MKKNCFSKKKIVFDTPPPPRNKKFKQHPINIKHYTAHPHDMPCTCKVSRKYSDTFWSYSAKTKSDGQTDRWTNGGHCNISHPGPSSVVGGKKIELLK